MAVSEVRSDQTSIWTTVWEQGSCALQGITALFFSTIGGLLPNSWGDKLHALWGHITTIYERLRGKIQVRALQAELATERAKVEELRRQHIALTTHNEETESREGLLRDEIARLRQESSALLQDHDKLEREANRLNAEVVKLQENDGVHKNERDASAKETAKLKMENLNLKRAKLEADEARERAEKKCKESFEQHQLALESLGAKRFDPLIQISRELQQTLESLRKSGEPPSISDRQKLLLQYRERRELFYQALNREIDLLPNTDEYAAIQSCLRGILGVLQNESAELVQLSELVDTSAALAQFTGTLGEES